MSHTISGRWAAAATAAGAGAHLAMVPGGGWMAALGLGMAAVCLPCAWHLWRAPSLQAARTVIGMSLAMVALHAALILGAGPAAHDGAHSHAAHAAHAASTAEAASGHTGAMLAAVAIDLLAAFAAAAWVRRQRTATGAVVHA